MIAHHIIGRPGESLGGVGMAVEVRVRIARSMERDDVNAVRELVEDTFPGVWTLAPEESGEPTLGVAHDVLMGLLDGTLSFTATEVCEQIKSWLHERAHAYPTPPETEVTAVTTTNTSTTTTSTTTVTTTTTTSTSRSPRPALDPASTPGDD